MGKGRLRHDLRKNYEKSLKVRIPLNLLKPFIISLPLKSYINAPAPNGEALCRRALASKQLPVGWHVQTHSQCTTLYKVHCSSQQHTASVTFSLVISEDLTWTLTSASIPILPSRVPTIPSSLDYFHQLLSLLITLDRSKLCIGNPDEKFLLLAESRHGKLFNQSGMN